eukprot:CAMPEP_0185774290 /NCGR_PEP_ID=MMETSP1174-20130828/77507_1 /TAXON_ID=35687 /ORGANISM="Dictyocha speculum, Strain CCMP1381" /LENGTH=58 /DNA_ID=CAMNT_0028461381 /DNA_START=110 /DNA_END=286 /DNA_ORIENTATION=+
MEKEADEKGTEGDKHDDAECPVDHVQHAETVNLEGGTRGGEDNHDGCSCAVDRALNGG